MKKFILSLFALFVCSFAFSMPGFESYIKDNSGDFVYYRDYTFIQESYVGLLMYDESSFQVRYYAKEDKKNNLPSRDISILVSIDPNKEYLELTGERLLTSISNTPEEIDILNYLHDFLYEFSSRRIKAGDISPTTANYKLGKIFQNNGVLVKQDYEQFGGKVYINFDVLIPFFNIKSITDLQNKKLLECVCIGIQSSTDNAFANFTGFNTKFKTNIAKSKSAKEKEFKYENLSVKIDENWNIDTNFAQLGDDALIGLSKLTITDSNDTLFSLLTLSKSFCMSFADNYVNLTNLEFFYSQAENKIKVVKTISVQDNMIKGIEIISKDKTSDDYNYFILSTFFHAYNTRRSYYDKIVKSYKAN